jgi:hypothetical protein
MAGFFTEQHLGVSACATWVQMLHGWKLWFLIRPKGETQSRWYDFFAFQNLAFGMEPPQLTANFDVWVLYLGPGTQLYVA